MIRILLLEDNYEQSEIIKKMLETEVEVVHVVYLSDVVNICEDEDSFFDFAILDLRIPESIEFLEPKENNGISAFRLFKQKSPGTPVLILTASSSNEHFRELIGEGTLSNIWGKREVNTVDYLRKSELEELDTIVKNLIQDINLVDDILLESNTDDFDINSLKLKQKRLFSIITHKLNGYISKVSPVTPGYSGASIFFLDVQDENRNTITKIIVKIGNAKKISEEYENYDLHVVSRLDNANFPPRLSSSKFGAKDLHSIYYRWLSNDKNMSVFEYINSDTFNEDYFRRIFDLTQGWRQASTLELKRIGDIRRIFVTDDKLSEISHLYNLGWVENFENRRVQFNMSVCHGDFHAGNIFINHETGTPSVIDYGDIRVAPACYDSIALELGFTYNKESKISDWPDINSALKWPYSEDYFKDCNQGEKLSIIREWTLKLTNNNIKEYIAVTYCYLLKQLCFNDVRQHKLEKTLNILQGLIACFNKS
ncbi:response regulator [Yersinia enterocolitica]|uniref:response regulator n=1 Tax=Yersinia enterocolitica TaxID=630 RepID=UPI003D78D869